MFWVAAGGCGCRAHFLPTRSGVLPSLRPPPFWVGGGPLLPHHAARAMGFTALQTGALFTRGRPFRARRGFPSCKVLKPLTCPLCRDAGSRVPGHPQALSRRTVTRSHMGSAFSHETNAVSHVSCPDRWSLEAPPMPPRCLLLPPVGAFRTPAPE